MQSWGTDSKFTIRETNREPSKSGVIGLCCAALGRSREENVSDLAELRMGVRINQEGLLSTDFQTAENVIKANGKSSGTVISTRYYLADAEFLVGLEGDNINLLKQIYQSLDKPKWQVYLGRKSYLPSEPVFLKDGLKEQQDLETALIQYPLDKKRNSLDDNQRLLILEVPAAEADQIRFDQPKGSAYETREFTARGIKMKMVEINSNKSPKSQTS